jgi:sporulation protein YlmC with PRC-barrel domain
MSRRILMATVAAIALAGPAAAQDQAKPLGTDQETTQQLERSEEILPEEKEGARAPAQPAGDAGAAPAAEQPPEAAQGQPPVTAPTRAEEQPAAPAEQELAGEEAAPPAEMSFLEVQDETQYLADEEVIGKSVLNVKDDEVGTIADLVLDQDQKLVGVVLSVGGFLGIGDKWVAVPVDQIEFPTDEQPARLLVAVTEEQLTNAPDFMTRAAVEAEEAAEQQAMQQPQQIPPPATAQ